MFPPIRRRGSRATYLRFASSATWGHAPSVIETLDARKLDEYLGLLPGAIVIIGGSYRASGDLHTTPLGAGVPGAIIHANAIRAFAMGDIVDERKSWALKSVLVVIAASVGTLAYAIGLFARFRLQAPFGHIVQLSSSLIGVLVALTIVFLVSLVWATAELAKDGTALGTVTPALAVAFEGASSSLQELKGMLHRLVSRPEN